MRGLTAKLTVPSRTLKFMKDRDSFVGNVANSLVSRLESDRDQAAARSERGYTGMETGTWEIIVMYVPDEPTVEVR